MSDFKLFYKLSNLNENTSSIFLKKPVIVGLMEIDRDSNIKYNRNGVRYFKLPKKENYPLNLNLGIEDYKFRSEIPLKNVVFRYLMDHHDNDGNKPGECLSDEKFDVISHRGALAALLMAPLRTSYNNQWSIFATYYNKKLYLYKPYGIDNNVHKAEHTYHFKFAQYCFTDDPFQDPDTNAPVQEDEQMYCIYRSALNKFNLIYSAEINGIIADKKLENVEHLKELNECRFVHTKLMKENIPNWRTNFRIQNLWAKSYFSAVNDVYVGFRSSSGFVNDPVEHVLLDKLMREQKWSPKTCSAFLNKILEKIIEEVKDVNCPYTTYELYFDSPSIKMKKHEGKSDKSFLPEEYIEHIMKN